MRENYIAFLAACREVNTYKIFATTELYYEYLKSSSLMAAGRCEGVEEESCGVSHISYVRRFHACKGRHSSPVITTVAR